MLSPGVVEVLFALLDADGDGRLDQKEFMRLMKRQATVPDPVSRLGLEGVEVRRRGRGDVAYSRVALQYLIKLALITHSVADKDGFPASRAF